VTGDTFASFRTLTKWLDDWSILVPIVGPPGRHQAVVKVKRPIAMEYRH
jgi:hypothetical protein